MQTISLPLSLVEMEYPTSMIFPKEPAESRAAMLFRSNLSAVVVMREKTFKIRFGSRRSLTVPAALAEKMNDKFRSQIKEGRSPDSISIRIELKPVMDSISEKFVSSVFRACERGDLDLFNNHLSFGA